MADRDTLLADLDAAREAFQEALAEVDLELATAPGVVGEWSVRDLVYHVAAWCEHGADALELAMTGRGDAFAYARDQTDAMNERFMAEGRSVSPADALTREESAFGRFRERISSLDPSLLTTRLGNGDTVEDVIVYDGREHYDEHTGQLRAWFAPEHEGDDA